MQRPGAESPGSELPATPAPPAPVTDTGAPKNPNPDHALQPRTQLQPVSVQAGMSTISGDELNVWHLPAARHVTAKSQGRPHLVDELQVRRIRSFSTEDQAPAVAQRRHVNNLVQEHVRQAATVGYDCLLHTCTRESARPANRGQRPRIRGMQLRNPQFSPLSDQSPVVAHQRTCRRQNQELHHGIWRRRTCIHSRTKHCARKVHQTANKNCQIQGAHNILSKFQVRKPGRR